MPPRSTHDVALHPVPVIDESGPWSLRERLARHALLVVLSALDLLANVFLATASRPGRAAEGIGATDWWYPLAGRAVALVVIWAIVVQLPLCAARSARLVQFLSLLVGASLAWTVVLLVSL